MAQREVGEPLAKSCSRCGREQSIEEFAPAVRTADGRIKCRHPRCRTCERKRRAEYRKAVKVDPERHARDVAYQRAYYASRCSDPAFRAAKHAYDKTPEARAAAQERARKARAKLKRSPRKLAAHRELYRLYGWERRRRNGAKEYGRENPGDPSQARLPVGPFRDWLGRMARSYGGLAELAEVVGEHERSLFRLLYEGQPSVVLDFVDRVLTREGSTFLAELYPELYPAATPEVLYMLRVTAKAAGYAEAA